MGAINAHNSTEFKSAKFIYSKVKRFLKSYDAANIIDEGEFPTYTKEVLKSLGPGVYMEVPALVEIKNGVGDLPDNFAYLYSAYKCSRNDGVKSPQKHLQNSSFGFITESEHTTYIADRNCEIHCCETNNKVIDKVSVKHYIYEAPEEYTYGNFIPLRVTNDVPCVDGRSFSSAAHYGISISDRKVHANFNTDAIYMIYYGFPIDENGEILIPDIEAVEKAIEWYIIWQILLGTWFNSTVPDIQGKWKYAEEQYDHWFATAKYYNKLPSFAESIDLIRKKRKINKLVMFTEQTPNTNFTRSY